MKKQRILTRSLIIMLASILLVALSSIPAFSKTYRWQPSSWLPSGIGWESIQYMSDYVTRMSNGRIQMKPSAPGAIVPVAEQLDAVGMGVMQATFIWPGYFPGQIPVAFTHGDCMAAPKTIAEIRHLYEEYEGGRIMELLRQEYAKHGVHLVGNVYWVLDNLMISRKPINGVKDIKGLKFRSSELIALQLAKLGAGTIWTPGDEIYTMLSTGGVDAITFSHAADMVDMGFHEVTKYWVKYPTAVGPAADAFIVNLKTWNALPDDLKAILEAACEIGTARNSFEAEAAIAEAWKFVEEKGINIIEWSEEDARILAGTAREAVPEKYFKDAAFKEIFEITEKWAVEKGYWEKK
ncbi:MAG: TRAP transporter substrate-binding protein [Desulfobacterales bacterium]|nr:TRAP transporter substrate-binding protein [Desulfobacterales bacterium]